MKPYWNQVDIYKSYELFASIRIIYLFINFFFSSSFLLQYPTLNIRSKISIKNNVPPYDFSCDEIDNIDLINIPSISDPSDSSSAAKKLVILPEEADELPHDCKDLLLRLMEYKPEIRIRSIFGLQRIAMYKNFNFEDVKKRKINPMDFFLTGDGTIV